MPICPWELACMKAILETEASLIYSRIIVARSSIAERLDGFKSVSEKEQAEIENALKNLKNLENERCANNPV